MEAGPTTNEERSSIRAVDRVLDLLEALRATPDGASLARLTEAVRVPKSSVIRYLGTLEQRGYVERTPGDGEYRLGPALLHLRPRQLDVLAHRARPYLEELRNTFEETINLGVLEGTRVAYLAISESPRTIRFAARAGDRDPVHSTALGKAIAAQLSDDEIRRILAVDGMPARTSRTITDPDEFLAALEKVRARGYAVDSGENEDDGCCVAVAIPASGIRAAVSVSAPAARLPLDRVEEVAAALLVSSRRLADELEHAHA